MRPVPRTAPAGRAPAALMAVVVCIVLLWPAPAPAGEISRAIFYVQCFGVGETTLKALPGVHRVKVSFHNFRPVVTAWYDPGVVSLDRLEEALVEADTFDATLEPDGRPPPPGLARRRKADLFNLD